MPHCVNKDKDNKCQAPLVEMMFGLVIQLAGRGAEGYQRCAQHRTRLDTEEANDQPTQSMD